MFKSLIRATTALGAAAFLSTTALAAGDLVITFDDLNPDKKAAFEAAVDAFKKANPDINVTANNGDREAHKSTIRGALQNDSPDVITWYPGNRMGPFVDAGLFMDISDMYANGDLPGLDAVKGAMTIDGKQWGVPYTYYQWGVYYRKDIFEELGLTEPATWEEEKANCQAIIDSGRKCYTIGSKFLWTAGGWFDYMNSRTNGYEFHIQLANGEVEWTDDRVRQTFANWRELIDMGAFIGDHQNYSWQEAMPFMVNGEAASYLMGNFSVAAFREGGLTDDQLDFYQFPVINPDVDYAEDAPTDTFHIPSGAQNMEAAKEFLRFVTSADVQTAINSGDALGQLPVNANSSIDADKFLEEGFEMLSNNAGGGIMQFFDRDFPAEMASVGMEGLQEFMVFPDNLDDILERLEDARSRIYQ